MKARVEVPTAHLMGPVNAMKAIQQLVGHPHSAGVEADVVHLTHLRVSQINGCSFCVDSASKHAKQAGVGEERLFAVAAWNDAPFFTDAERAALKLAEVMTRLGDRENPVSDEVWADVCEHFDEREATALVLWVSTINMFNRFNVATRQIAGSAVW